MLHDDLSLPLGTVRVRDKGSDGGNNGIKSISSHIGSDYWRIRIGIWDEKRELQPDADFVLSRLPTDGTRLVQEKITPVVTEMIEKFYVGSLSATSHQTDTER